MPVSGLGPLQGGDAIDVEALDGGAVGSLTTAAETRNSVAVGASVVAAAGGC